MYKVNENNNTKIHSINNGNEYSYKVILEPLDVFDWDAPGVAEGNDKGGKINDTLIQYLESIVKYMKSEERSKDYDYKIIVVGDGDNPITSSHHEINLENLEEFISGQLELPKCQMPL